MEYIKANAVSYTLEDPRRAMLHVCNDVGVMGSGIAKEVKERVPEAFWKYEDSYKFGEFTSDTGYNIINLCAQHKYKGYKGDYADKKYLNYGALSSCLITACSELLTKSTKNTIVIPYLMGSDRAGGDWATVIEIVEFFFGGHFKIVICEL